MSPPTGLLQSPLSIVLDIRQPLAYLALGPAISFARERELEVDWLPLEGQPLRAPSEPRPDDDRGIRHRRHRARAIAREIAVYARAQGLTVREPYRAGASRAANLAWLWVRVQAPSALPALLGELFRRYWLLELDPNDLDDVTDVLRKAGLYSPQFDSWVADAGDREAERVASTLRDAGVSQTPAYRVGDELFYGRQHLAMIRWLMNGRAGPGPI